MSSTPNLLRKSFRLAPLALLLFGLGAHAQHGDFGHVPHGGMERHEFHEPFHTDHWVFDDRFHHDHFYPALGYAIATLPYSNIGIAFGGRRFFYGAGVWYEPSGAGYVVVQPPVGIVAPALPPAYTTVNVGGIPYYYANGTYYVATAGGYAVAQPPADPAALASAVVPPPPGTWSYCESAKRYYPYVTECPEGWRSVPATPPNITQR